MEFDYWYLFVICFLCIGIYIRQIILFLLCPVIFMGHDECHEGTWTIDSLETTDLSFPVLDVS